MKINPQPRAILENEAGLTILPWGVIKFRESLQFYEQIGKTSNKLNSDPERVQDSRIAHAHEFIHFLQSFTTAYVFNHCEEIRFLVGRFLNYLKNGHSLEAILQNAKDAYEKIVAELSQETAKVEPGGVGISPNHLMEGMAVIESIRSIFPEEEIANFLGDYVSKIPNIAYGRILGVMVREFGLLPTVRLTSTICFLSLQTENPGESFASIYDDIRACNPNAVAKLRSIDLINKYMADLSVSIISRAKGGEEPSKALIWNRLLQNFASLGSIEDVHLAAANPSSILALTNLSSRLNEDKIKEIMPPLTMYEDGRCKIGSCIPSELSYELLDFVSISGAVLRAVVSDPSTVLCSHRECPVYKTGLCHYHYPPAEDSTWTECRFPDLFDKVFHMTPEQFFAKI